jgi:hypothetical protein
MKEVRVCSNKGPGHLQRGDNHKNVKIGRGHLEIFLSRTTSPILADLAQIILESRRDLSLYKIKGIAPLQGEVIAKE